MRAFADASRGLLFVRIIDRIQGRARRRTKTRRARTRRTSPQRWPRVRARLARSRRRLCFSRLGPPLLALLSLADSTLGHTHVHPPIYHAVYTQTTRPPAAWAGPRPSRRPTHARRKRTSRSSYVGTLSLFPCFPVPSLPLTSSRSCDPAPSSLSRTDNATSTTTIARAAIERPDDGNRV